MRRVAETASQTRVADLSGVSIAPFDYDAYWRRPRDDWRDRGLHWHCYTSRMDGATFGNDLVREDPNTDAAPKIVRDWLRKPARTLQHVATTPDDAVEWLRGQWESIKPSAGEAATAIDPETLFGRALYDLSCGTDICWGYWISGGSTHVQMAVVGVADTCHG